jgi:hypothetical protein
VPFGRLIDYRPTLDVQRIRHTLTRKRRLVASVLAGLGVVFLISALRPATPVSVESASVVLARGEVAVPVVVRPSGVIQALEPGMVIDLIGENHTSREARIIRIPASGFGTSSDAVVVVAVAEEQGVALTSHAASGMGVIIRPNTRE